MFLIFYVGDNGAWYYFEDCRRFLSCQQIETHATPPELFTTLYYKPIYPSITLINWLIIPYTINSFD